MKRIRINTFKYGVIINTETYIINNINFFIKDMLEEYINIKQQNSIINNIEYEYNIIIDDIEVVDDYEFYKELKNKCDEEKNKLKRYKRWLEKLQEHANKYRRK